MNKPLCQTPSNFTYLSLANFEIQAQWHGIRRTVDKARTKGGWMHLCSYFWSNLEGIYKIKIS
jgi:hypothetical protein